MNHITSALILIAVTLLLGSLCFAYFTLTVNTSTSDQLIGVLPYVSLVFAVTLLILLYFSIKKRRVKKVLVVGIVDPGFVETGQVTPVTSPPPAYTQVSTLSQNP